MKSLRLLLLLAIVGCQSRLVPVAFKASDTDAHVAVGTQDHITVFLENLEYKSDIMVFDLEIVNESEDGFYFDPEKIFFYTSSDDFKAVNHLEENWHEKALASQKLRHPMSKRSAENYYRKSIRSKGTSKFLVGLVAVGATALNIAGGSGEFVGGSVFSDVAREVLVGASIVGSEIATEALTQSQIKDDEDLYYLDDEILKAANVPAGSSVRGKVFFERADSNSYYRFVIPLTYYDFIFDMREARNNELQYLR